MSKQMVDPEGRHFDWDYGTSTWVPAQQGVFADAPAGGKPLQTFSQHTTPDAAYVQLGSVWHKQTSEGLLPETPDALRGSQSPVVTPYVAPDLRDHFDCPECGDAVVLRHVIRRTGREQIQCLGCQKWHDIVS